MNSSRLELFAVSLERAATTSQGRVKIVPPKQSTEQELTLFHSRAYVEQVKELSGTGDGFLDYPDTPAFPGVYEASLYTVGSTLWGLRSILGGECDHYFNPVGGLHHAARDRASGFCVFDDAGVAIESLLDSGTKRIAYIDIDAHHGDGVFYAFEGEPRVFIADIHEDGRSLFPGTGSASETGRGPGQGTKLNLPLPAGAGDREFFPAFERALDFVKRAAPEFILLQCGADGIDGDPLTHLRYSPAAHTLAASRLHALSHEVCGGRMLVMGGGGYSAANVDAAWSAVLAALT